MKKLITGILRLQEGFGTLLLAIFFIAILMQIGARYLGIAVLWTEEVANYSFIWAVFMGASAMIFHRAHFSFTFFRDKFQGRVGALYSAGISLILLAFTIALLVYGVQITRTFWNYNWISLPWMKMGYTWLCLPITGFTMSLYNVYHIVTDITVATRKEATV